MFGDSFKGVVLRRYIPKSQMGAVFIDGFGLHTEVTLEDSLGDLQHLDADGVWQPKDCYSIAVAIIEGCAFAKNRRLGSFSNRLTDELATDRWSSWPGCACFDVYRVSGGTRSHFLRIFVSVVADDLVAFSPHSCQKSAYSAIRALRWQWDGYEVEC
jgi:hypothetical protein